MSSAALWIIPSLVGVLAVACAAPQDDDVEEARGSATSRLVGCSQTREQIVASVSGARRAAVERGFEWLDADVPYSQSRSHEGYRTDCSGFVSMCWGMERSSNTSAFYSGDGNERLGSYEDLEVADALVKRGHIVLFLGWNDDDHEGACVLEQASTASDMQFRVRTRASLERSGYKAIRADRIASDPSSPSPSSVMPQSSADVGDPGDPDEDVTSADPSSSEHEEEPRNSRVRGGSALESQSCSLGAPGASTSALPLWAFALAVGAAARRRRSNA